jgi:hypothetical protein
MCDCQRYESFAAKCRENLPNGSLLKLFGIIVRSFEIPRSSTSLGELFIIRGGGSANVDSVANDSFHKGLFQRLVLLRREIRDYAS